MNSSDTAIVTGAGNGLGRAIALALGSRGIGVLLVGRTLATLQETAELLVALGADSEVATCDVSSPDEVESLKERFSHHDVSILINNAGIPGPVKNLVSVTPDEWDEVFNANVRSVYLMSRAFLPPMIAAHRGDIINIASVSGKRPLERRTPYVASKMAILGLTRTLAFEVGPLGVSVNSLSPGPVRGPRMDRVFTADAEAAGVSVQEAEDRFVSRAALNRLVEAEEVGEAVVAMLSMKGLCGADIDLSAGMIAP
jgi:NAD(P)-dependent dehydrogenase (short-subunit alcohol dehydrogenase family)